jgi:hypothetical protein
MVQETPRNKTTGAPLSNHWGGLLYIVGLEGRRVGKILGVSRKPKRIQFWNKSWWDAVDTNRVRMAANVEEHGG